MGFKLVQTIEAQVKKSEIVSQFLSLIAINAVCFLGPRGPLVLPLMNPRTRPPVRNENLDTYIQAYMPHDVMIH